VHRLARRYRSLAGTAAVGGLLAIGALLLPSAAAAEVTPATTCSQVSGSELFALQGERQIVTDALSTNLAEPQMLRFTWEFGHQEVTLAQLVLATCVVTPRGDQLFVGVGTAEVDAMPGFRIVFFIKIKPDGESAFYARIKHGRETVASFRDHGRGGETAS
jgi:hypothetical protein